MLWCDIKKIKKINKKLVYFFSFVRRSFVRRSFVRRSFVRRSFVCRSFVRRNFLQRSLRKVVLRAYCRFISDNLILYESIYGVIFVAFIKPSVKHSYGMCWFLSKTGL